MSNVSFERFKELGGTIAVISQKGNGEYQVQLSLEGRDATFPFHSAVGADEELIIEALCSDISSFEQDYPEYDPDFYTSPEMFNALKDEVEMITTLFGDHKDYIVYLNGYSV